MACQQSMYRHMPICATRSWSRKDQPYNSYKDCLCSTSSPDCCNDAVNMFFAEQSRLSARLEAVAVALHGTKKVASHRLRCLLSAHWIHNESLLCAVCNMHSPLSCALDSSGYYLESTKTFSFFCVTPMQRNCLARRHMPSRR